MDENIVEFVVPGPPVGKGRPRFSTINGHAVAYTPEKTASFENLVRLAYKQAYPDKKPFDKGVQLSVTINAYFPIPKATSKKKAALMKERQIRPTTKPDLDNLAKSICDALNKVAFYDDSQVVVLKVRKFYDETPQTDIIIFDINAENCYYDRY